MTDLRQDSMTGEQWVLEERSADPPSTEEGERWLRTDLNSGDKIATLRVDVGSSIHDVPIFSTGTAVDTVSEAMRIQVNGTTGYVPIAPVSDAAFPELRMQHNSQVHGFHDRVESGSAIPDSVVDNFEQGNISVSKNNWTGWTGDTSSFSAQQSTVLEGDWSAQLDAAGGTFTDAVATRDSVGSPTEIRTLAQANSRSGVANDAVCQLQILNGSTMLCDITLRSSGEISAIATSRGGTWSTGTAYLLRFYNIDWENNLLDWEVVDNSDGTVRSSSTSDAFGGSANGADVIRLRNDSNDGAGQTAFFDYVEWV